jgi:hypothetical protein
VLASTFGDACGEDGGAAAAAGTVKTAKFGRPPTNQPITRPNGMLARTIHCAVRRTMAPSWRRTMCTSPPTAHADLVNQWMADPELVSPNLGFFGRTQLWLSLGILPGLDLPEFLCGARLAYATVTRSMYERDWAFLDPLVSPQMLEAMQFAMNEFGDNARRVEGFEAADAIELSGARLVKAQILKPDEEWERQNASSQRERWRSEPRRCHLDVQFLSHESWKIIDYRLNEAIEPFDGRRREQQSTWRFEGVVYTSDSPDTALDQGAGESEEGWTVHAIV